MALKEAVGMWGRLRSTWTDKRPTDFYPSSECKTYSATEEIARFLLNPNSHCCIHVEQSLGNFMRHERPFHITIRCCRVTNFVNPPMFSILSFLYHHLYTLVFRPSVIYSGELGCDPPSPPPPRLTNSFSSVFVLCSQVLSFIKWRLLLFGMTLTRNHLMYFTLP